MQTPAPSLEMSLQGGDVTTGSCYYRESAAPPSVLQGKAVASHPCSQPLSSPKREVGCEVSVKKQAVTARLSPGAGC